MTGVGGTPRTLDEFIRDTRRRLTAVERRQTPEFVIPEFEVAAPLPEPSMHYATTDANTITAGTGVWQDIAGISRTFVLDTPLWVEISYGSEITTTDTVYAMIGVRASGDLVIDGQTDQQSGNVNRFGQTPFGVVGASADHLHGERILLLPVGTTTLQMGMRRNGSTGTQTLSYPKMQVTPLMWVGTPGATTPTTGDGITAPKPSQEWDFRMTPSAWSGPVGTRLTIPTHVTPAGGQTTHPSVAYFPEKWNGYRYWMAHSPYPGSNDDHEDPNLAVSDDGITWIAAPGVTQPLDDADGTPEYNSDPDLVMGPDGRMYLFWRYYDSSLGSFQEKVYMRTSTDGVTWTAKALVYQFTETVRRPLSPSFVYENGRWTVWAVDVATPATPVLMRMQTSGSDPTSGWGTSVNCTVSAYPAGKAAWHVEVRRLGGQYVALMCATDAGSGGVNGTIFPMVSTDGLAWTGATATAIPVNQAGEHDMLYRATFIPEFNDGDMALRVWYSAYTSGAPTVWNIYRTLLKVPATAGSGPFAQAAGSVTGLAAIAAGTGTTTAITFPVGRFTVPPIVTITTFTSTRLTAAVVVVPTTTGCSVRLENWTAAQASGTLGFAWHAVQMTSGTAEG